MTNSFTPQPSAPTNLTLTTTKVANALPDDSYQLALTIAEAADDRKGRDIVILNVAEVSYITDYFVIVSGFSHVQVKAIARSIEDKVQTQWQRPPLQLEGQAEGSWVLIDYGDVIAHIFMPQEREFYNLEAFWGHAERIPFTVSQLTRDSVQ
ncbi:MAG: ribosome silencing factor [Leptolyngbyaceae cyanobacterium SL_7_1]|nr:ribosome silencing factor [Leptolyngbyaceae cyanobacterium SL_7_1]